MATWPFLVLVLTAWAFWILATVIQKGVQDLENQVPKDQRRGTSWLGIFPLFPLLIAGLAILGDWAFRTPWVTKIVASLHALVLIVMMGFLIAGLWRMRSLK